MNSNRPMPSWLSRILGTVLVAGAIVLGLIFSVIAITALFVLGVAGGAYLWWKKREIERQLRSSDQEKPDQNLIEGEYQCIEITRKERHHY